jgi:uncharacterized cupin superfamily protein
MVEEARLIADEAGLVPEAKGWFVVNVRDTSWIKQDDLGAACTFEGPDARFEQFGINIHVIQPGQPNCMYHAEGNQEDFLVLAGECLLLVEDQERPLQAWDFVHCPPDTTHVFVGAGEGVCVILMVGGRTKGASLFYPRSELALRHGAGVEQGTASGEEAYAPYPGLRRERPDGWDSLPWV